jgi:uncharacterized protein (DUF885 family)
MRTRSVLGALIGTLVLIAACSRGEAPRSSAAMSLSGDEAFGRLEDELLTDWLARNPTFATYLGIHTNDFDLEDVSRNGIQAEIAALRQFRRRFAAIDAATLSPARQFDLELVLHAIDSRLLDREVIRSWAKNPDTYSSGITQSAYIMIKRNFAPPEVRLRGVRSVGRENPPPIYTSIAIEQLDGNRAFFESAVPAAFATVKDPTLRDEFTQANRAVIAALRSYKTFLEQDLQPRSHGDFAIGADTLTKKFATDEMVDLPLDRLLAIADADLRRNKEAFEAAAAKTGAGPDPRATMLALSREHPTPNALLGTTQRMLDSLRVFIESKHLLTIPAAPPAKVEETPPFMRATTSASMDTPGPFEVRATEAYYNMTLPDPEWSKPKIEEYMRNWYPAMISNVSVHEVYPGHYTQFLYAPQFPSKIRKVFGANTNSEGWAHYCEEMMLDEGLGDGDPKLRLAQLQDALLRDVRFIVGIKLHTNQLTLAQAQKMFEEEAYQPAPVALSEAKRGTSDPTYGYYTLGKLMILKLRDDYRAKLGAQYSPAQFHDTFLKLGALPLPLMRKAMLGETGQILPN